MVKFNMKNVLNKVFITPAVHRAWLQKSQHAVGLLPRGINIASIPDEQAYVQPDGTLLIFVELPTGNRVEMRVSPDNWVWAV